MLLSRQDQLANPNCNHQWHGGHQTRFCRRAAESIHHLHSFRFLTKKGGEYQNRMLVEWRARVGGIKQLVYNRHIPLDC